MFAIQADFYKALGNAARLQIVHALRGQSLNVTEIAQTTGYGQSFVSRQLSNLRNAGVVELQRHGREAIYRLSDPGIGEFCDLVRKVMCAQIDRQSEAFSSTDL